MKYDFQVIGIKKEEIAHLFQLNEKECAEKGVVRMKVDAKPGYPCRVSLSDADIGEEIIAFNYSHHNVTSPYRSSGPVFVRVKATAAELQKNEIPIMLNHRLLSLRVYNNEAMMIDARTIEGIDLEKTIQDIFANVKAKYIQVHNSSPGCYNCQINR